MTTNNKKFPLTETKEDWARHRKGKLLGTKLAHNASTQEKYAHKLHQLVIQMNRETKKEIATLFKSLYTSDATIDTNAMDANIGSQARILLNKLSEKFNSLFASKAKSLADRMFGAVDRTSTMNLHSSLKQLSGGLSLKTGVVPKGFEDIATATIADNVKLIKSIPQEYFKQITGSVMRSITQGKGLKDLIPEIEKYDEQSTRRAKNIALDQTRKAYNTINAKRLQGLNITHFEWMHSGGSASPRQSHLKIDGTVFSFKDLEKEQADLGVPEQDRGLPSIPPNCFLGSTQISLSNGCTNLWRYWHDGDIVNIKLHSGEIIECTLNHPILTLRGWLPANAIQQSDYLIGCQFNNSSIINNEQADFKTTFDDFFASVMISDNSTIRSGSMFNFHGDIPKNQVDTIRIDNMSSNGIEIMDAQQIENFIFSLSDIIRDFIQFSFVTKITQASKSGIFRQFFALIDGQTFHSYFVCLSSTAQDNPIFLKNSINSCSSSLERISETKSTFAVFVSFNNDGSICIDHILFSGSRQNIIKSFFKTYSEFTRADFINFTKSTQAHTGIKFLHSIDHKTIGKFSGHVYTLESNNGWFSISSTHIISKNCKCTIRPIIDLSGENN